MGGNSATSAAGAEATRTVGDIPSNPSKPVRRQCTPAAPGVTLTPSLAQWAEIKRLRACRRLKGAQLLSLS